MTSGSTDGDPRMPRQPATTGRAAVAMIIGAVLVTGLLLLGGRTTDDTAAGRTKSSVVAVDASATPATVLVTADMTAVASGLSASPLATDVPIAVDPDLATTPTLDAAIPPPVALAIMGLAELFAVGQDVRVAAAAPKDSDGDGVPDSVERRLGTKPNRRDSDRDGTPDGKEDPDRDRLTTLFELDRTRTDPGDPDSNNDGTRDSVEDFDGDKLSNAAEQRLGLNPRRRDTNRDGQDDWHEDADRDGRPNGLEQDRFRLPTNLTPKLRNAGDDVSPSSDERCHSRQGLTKPGSCSWGDRDGPLVLIFGDSHAVQWFPAIRKVARERGWHLMSMTKSACPFADVTTIRDKRLDTACVTWRKKALAKIARLEPELVIATSLDVYRFSGDGGNPSSASSEAKWGAGLERTLRKLRKSADKVIMLGDSHDWGSRALDCLADHPGNVSACVTRANAPVQVRRERTARKAAADARVPFASTRKLSCPYDPCPLVVDRFLVTRDGGHLSATYAALLWRGMERILPDV
jgi:hypothetical protein